MTTPTNPPAITPEKAEEFLTLYANDFPNAWGTKLATEYLKLHEENTRLSNMLKAAEITEQDNMQLREENTRLQAFLKTIADFIDYPSMSKWVSDDVTEGEAILAGQVGGAYAILNGCKMYSVFEDENARLQGIVERQRQEIEMGNQLLLVARDIIDRKDEALSLTATEKETKE